MNQIELHNKIDELILKDPDGVNREEVFNLISVNNDAKRFFFAQANESWFGWLRQNGFLDEIKNKAEDLTKYSYRMPELEYLIRMAEKEPAKVAQIIDSVKISEANFNPEVVDRFLWIINSLPAEQIKTLTAKIRDEKWVYLMHDFRKSGYEFDKIVEKLTEENENKAMIELAQAIFTARTKKEISEKEKNLSMDSPFYINDLNASGIFEALANIEENYTEQALKVLTDTIAEIIKLSRPDDTKVFDYVDLFSLFDVDFFTVEIEGKEDILYREDIKNLGATVTKLVKRTINKKCEDINEAKRLFKYIDDLPSCRSIWRLRLFVLAQCPDIFRKELKDAFFKLFDVENYYEIEGGTEYKKALKIAFPYLSDADQRDYVKRVIGYFIKKDREEESEKEDWHIKYGSMILSMITSQLTEEEKQTAKDAGFTLSSDYKPEPSIGKIESGFVSHRSPVNIEDYSVEQIIKNLKFEWTPKKLKEQFKNDEFLSPRGVEGLGDALKEDIKKRTDDYCKNINGFFDRDNIHSHYLYSLLRGVEEMLRNKQSLSLAQINQILGLFKLIENAGKETPFRRKDDKSWLVDWVEIHKVIIDILLYFSKDKEKRKEIHKAHRKQIKDLISYLFTIPDPLKEHEKPEYGDLYHVAINSVRGRAFEAFVVFTGNDDKTLAEDTKKIYKEILADDSLAVRFVVGRYLATFYFRDKEFITNLFPEIFSKDDPDKKDIYLATWEGYLSNTLYDKLFVVLKDYYSHAITLNPKDYTQRKYSKGLDESLAVHLALAFVHLGLEIEDPLFTQFWDTANTIRYKEFISFIGRSCLTRDQAGDEWLKENKVSKEKLIKFWDWILKNVSEPEALSGFGFWINPNKEVLNDDIVVEKIAQTLKKSDGDINWDYGLLKRMPTFAKKNREKTLEIISSYLLDSNNNLNQNRRMPLLYEEEIKEAMEIIYKNGNREIKQKVTDLINMLIEKGSSMFWELKEVIEDK